MPGVPAVLLDHVAHEPPQVGVLPLDAGVHGLIESAVGQRPGDPPARPDDGGVPELVERTRRVPGRSPEIPVRFGVPVDLRPRRAKRRPRQLLTELMVLDESQVLEQPAQRQRGRADPATQPGRVEPVRLEAERRPQPVERRQKLLRLGALQRWVPGGVCHGARLAKVPDILLPRKSSNPSSRTGRGDSAPPRPPMLAVIANQARRSDRTSQTCHTKKVSPAGRTQSPPRPRTSVR